ncbi:nitrogen regulatory protein P-II homolog [Euphorbia lathyris]|uniref:nitrogen regulatory protein P-II homolog n=1 Tax=Euphorbia lathyris TaxID=212925 RepID=UPI00331406C5
MATTAKLGFLTSLHSLNKDLPLFPSTLILPKLSYAPFSQLNSTVKLSRYASIVPSVRAQGSPDYTPDAKFYKVEAIVRPWRVSQVSSALLKIGIRGVTVSDVRGFGAQGGSTERQGGSEFSEDKFVAKVKMEIVVSKDQVEAVIEQIIEEARTGEIGDGKIFVVPVSDVIRIRTGERGEKGERMTGGRSDMTSFA